MTSSDASGTVAVSFTDGIFHHDFSILAAFIMMTPGISTTRILVRKAFLLTVFTDLEILPRPSLYGSMREFKTQISRGWSAIV